jgi:membrane protein
MPCQFGDGDFAFLGEPGQVVTGAQFSRFLRILPRVYHEYVRDDASFLAAGIAFYALLSLFPMLLVGILTMSLILPAGAEAHNYSWQMAAVYLPSSTLSYVKESIQHLQGNSGRAGIAGLVALLWSGRHLFRALELGLHRAWEIPVRRSFVRGNLLAIALLLLCALLTLAAGLVTATLTWIQAMLSHLPQPQVAGFTLDQAIFWAWLHSWLLQPLTSAIIFLILYVLLPSRQVPFWAAVPGAVFAAIAWRVSSWIYVHWALRLLELNPVYASVGGLAGLVLWLYFGGMVFMVGAELVYCVLEEYYPDLPKVKKRHQSKLKKC